MQFNLRFFQMALMTGVCLTSFGYSASLDVVVVVDDLLSAQPKKVIGPGQAVNDKSLRDDFFEGFTGDKEKLLKALIGIATTKGDIGLATKDFLEEAARKGFFTVEELAVPLSGERASLAQYLQGYVKWSSSTTSQQPLPIQAHAFAAPQTLHIEPTELPGASRITLAPSTLTLSEQIYALNVRSNLSGAGLDAALARLDEILKLTKQIAISDETTGSYEGSANLVRLVGVIRGISPVISGYLRSVNVQLAAIVPSTEKVLTGYLWNSSVREFSEEQQLQRAALQARQELALAVFDALLGTILRPAAVPIAVDFRIDQSPDNRLASAVHTIHATLPVVVASKAFTVNSNGTVDDEPVNPATEVIRGETVTFLRQVWSAVILTGNTAITEFAVAVIAAKEVAEHKE